MDLSNCDLSMNTVLVLGFLESSVQSGRGKQPSLSNGVQKCNIRAQTANVAERGACLFFTLKTSIHAIRSAVRMTTRQAYYEGHRCHAASVTAAKSLTLGSK